MAEPALVLLAVCSSPPAASGWVLAMLLASLAGCSPVLSLMMLLKTPVTCFPFWVYSGFLEGGREGGVFQLGCLGFYFFCSNKVEKRLFPCDFYLTRECYVAPLGQVA